MIVQGFAEPSVGAQIAPPPGKGFVLRTHAPDACQGRACVVHNPSDHHMSHWPLNWRADRIPGLMERICEHGTGHPDPDALAYEISQGRAWQGVHGCCEGGCCHAPGSLTADDYEHPVF